MTVEELKNSIDKWRDGILSTYSSTRESCYVGADTYGMIKDIDKIIADAFDHEYVIIENT